MKGSRVSIDYAEFEYVTEGSFESAVSKEYPAVRDEIDVFYQDLFRKGGGRIVADEPQLPASIFSQSLSPLQAIVKYLHEGEAQAGRALPFSAVARLLNRDPRTIWATYDSVKDSSLKDTPSEVSVPLRVFRDRKFSTLESLVKHLLSRGFSINKVASLLGKGYQTVWTVKRRFLAKENAGRGGGADE